MLEFKLGQTRTAAEVKKSKVDKGRRAVGGNVTKLSVVEKGTPEYGPKVEGEELIILEHMALRCLTFISPVRTIATYTLLHVYT